MTIPKKISYWLRLFILIISIVTVALGQVATAQETSQATPSSGALSLVVIGDSIAFNSPEDCPGCTGFVDRYAAQLSSATGRQVEVQNLSQHTGLQIDNLLGELETDTEVREALATANIIIVNIAHNDVAWNRNDDPCDGPTGDTPDWSKFDATCSAASAEMFRPKFESLFSQVVALRNGEPTIFRTINRYNDWVGTEYGDGSAVPPEATKATKNVLDAWNAMLCEAAQANGFTCVDIYQAFNSHDGLKPSGDLLGSDFVHPSDEGSEVIARVLADVGYSPLVP